MPEYKLSKEIGLINFELFLETDLDNLGNIISFEFYDGFHYYDNPFDICFSKVYCDETKQDEWNFFLNGLLNLFESNELFDKIKKLKKEEDSYYFDEEKIDLILLEID